MADLINNVQEVYKKWESKSKPRYNAKGDNRTYQGNFCRQPQHGSYFDGENKRSQQPRTRDVEYMAPPRWQRNNRVREKITMPSLPKYHGIAQFKMSPLLVLQNKERPFKGTCCPKCFPLSSGSIEDTSFKSLGIRDVLRLPDENRNAIVPKSLRQIFFLLNNSANYKYQDASPAVLKNERLQLAVVKASHGGTEQVGNAFTFESVSSTKEWRRVKKFLHGMKSQFSSLLSKFSDWFLFLLLGRMFDSININMGQIELLTKVTKNDLPIVYLPLHRSYLDYLIINFILHVHKLRSPLMAITERIQYPSLNYLLRLLGAFHTNFSLQERTKLNASVLHALQQSYIGENMKAGHHMEFFLDRSRSQSGKSCLHESDLISALLESLIEGHIEDAYIVPVAVSYEKVVDGSFIQEQLGKSSELPNSLSTMVFLWNILHSNFGSARVDFCQPFTLKEFLHTTKHANAFKAMSSLETPPSSPSSRSSHVKFSANEKDFSELNPICKDLGQHAIYDATNSAALMSTQLISFLFLTKHRKGATQSQLLYSFNWLRKELKRKKWDVGFSGESTAVLKHAVNLLGKDLVESELISMELTSSDMKNSNVKPILYKPAIKLPYVLELQYYANAILPVFLMESIVANALFAVLDEEIEMLHDCDSKLIVMRQQLVDKAAELIEILQFEFLFAPPCNDIISEINDVIENLKVKECLQACGDVKIIGDRPLNSYMGRSQYDFSSDDEETCVERDQQLKVMLSEESISSLQFLRSILSPYIESYWLASCALLKLVKEEMEEVEFFHEIQKTAQERLHKGLLAYEESFAAESLFNSVKLFKHWNVVEHCNYNSIKIVYLHYDYNFEEGIAQVISKIEQFRK